MEIFFSEFLPDLMEQIIFTIESIYVKQLEIIKRNAVVPYSQLMRCAKWTYNIHNNRTYKEHRNLKIRKHVTTSCSGTKPFY